MKYMQWILWFIDNVDLFSRIGPFYSLSIFKLKSWRHRVRPGIGFLHPDSIIFSRSTLIDFTAIIKDWIFCKGFKLQRSFKVNNMYTKANSWLKLSLDTVQHTVQVKIFITITPSFRSYSWKWLPALIFQRQKYLTFYSQAHMYCKCDIWIHRFDLSRNFLVISRVPCLDKKLNLFVLILRFELYTRILNALIS